MRATEAADTLEADLLDHAVRMVRTSLPPEALACGFCRQVQPDERYLRPLEPQAPALPRHRLICTLCGGILEHYDRSPGPYFPSLFDLCALSLGKRQPELLECLREAGCAELAAKATEAAYFRYAPMINQVCNVCSASLRGRPHVWRAVRGDPSWLARCCPDLLTCLMRRVLANNNAAWLLFYDAMNKPNGEAF